MDDLNLFMRNRRLPDDLKVELCAHLAALHCCAVLRLLQSRIRTYYRNIWSRHGGLDDKSILGALTRFNCDRSRVAAHA